MATNLTDSMGYKVDWFQCTESDNFSDFLLLKDSKFWNFLEELGYKLEDFEESSARYFYEKGLTLSRYFTIYYNLEKNPYTGPTIYFQFTGQGSTDLAQKLASFYKINDFAEIWFKFFKQVVKFELNVTRLDIALDDYAGVLNFDKIERKLTRREFKASKRSYNIVKEKSTDGKIKGETIYLGARKRHQNGYIVRFYDKLAEYKAKGAIVPTEVENVVTGEGSHVWQRYEIEIRGSAAMNFIEKILGGYSFGQVYKGLMRNTIEFLKPNRKNVNRAYWKMADWWSDFLDDAEKCSLTDPERDVNLGRLLKWLYVGVSQSLHLLQDIGEVRGFDIYEMLKAVPKKDYAKKQERLKHDVLAMSQEDLEMYLNQFKEGGY